MRKIFTLFIILFSSSLFAQEYSEEQKEIFIIQDTRSEKDYGKLLEYLESGDNEVVTSALIAFANMQDSSYSEEVGEVLISNESEAVKNAGAFALGQMGGAVALEYLRRALLKEKNYRVNGTIIDALGKVGNEKTLDLLILTKNPDLQSAAALAIARLAIRGIKNAAAVNYLQSITGNFGETETYEAYAFWRIGDADLLKPAEENIHLLTQSLSPNTRAWGYLALGKLKDEKTLNYIIDSFDSETDWHVRVNMLNALRNYNVDSIGTNKSRIVNLISKALNSDNENVRITALNVLGVLFSPGSVEGVEGTGEKPVVNEVMKLFQRVIDSPESFTWRERAAALRAYAMIFKDSSASVLFRNLAEAENYSLKSEIIKDFAYLDNGDIFRQVLDSITLEIGKYNALNPNTTGELIPSRDLGELYLGYVEMLTGLLPKIKDKDNLNIARLSFIEFADSKQSDIVYYSLEGLKDSLISGDPVWKNENEQVLKFEYESLKYPEDLDVMVLFIEAFGDLKSESMTDDLKKNLDSESRELAYASAGALKKITGQNYEDRITNAKYRTDFDWSYLNNIFQKKFVTLVTNKGNIKIQLFPAAAPFTVMNFLKLAESGYYDGKIFHRVVPNFVIQGGDPEGTGFGGPGYSIRSEFAPISYGTGFVGMASAGKDTEGSQFFITHSPQPHLDGRYTIFGTVLTGMEVVEDINVNDILEDVIISSN